MDPVHDEFNSLNAAEQDAIQQGILDAGTYTAEAISDRVAIGALKIKSALLAAGTDTNENQWALLEVYHLAFMIPMAFLPETHWRGLALRRTPLVAIWLNPLSDHLENLQVRPGLVCWTCRTPHQNIQDRWCLSHVSRLK